MDRVNLVQLNSALTAAEPSSRKSLSNADLSVLLAEMDTLMRRYPSQDQEESVEAYQQDLEALAVKYSISTVVNALRDLRIRPGQKFFPRPDEVAEEIENQRERKMLPGATESQRRAEEREANFWGWVKSRMQDEDTQGMTTQQFLDTVKVIGFIGRKESEMPR